MVLELSAIRQATQGIDYKTPMSCRFGLRSRSLPDLADAFRQAFGNDREQKNVTDQTLYHGLIGRSRAMKSLDPGENPFSSYIDSVAGNAAIDVLGTLNNDPALKFVMAGQAMPAILELGRNIFREYCVLPNFLRSNPPDDSISPAADAVYWTIGNWVDRQGLVSELKAAGMFEEDNLRSTAGRINYGKYLVSKESGALVTYPYTSFVDLFVAPSSDLSVQAMVDLVTCPQNIAITLFTTAARQSAFNVVSKFSAYPGISRLLRAFAILGCSQDIALDLVALAETICSSIYRHSFIAAHESERSIEEQMQEAVLDQLKTWASGLEQF